MPKKTSRSARALEAQRSATTGGERKNAARPLVNLNTTNLSVNTGRVDLAPDPLETSDTTATGHGIYEAPELATSVTEARITPAGQTGGRSMPRESNSTVMARPVISPATGRRPIGRRTTNPVNRQPVLTRDEEYAYIRTDLLTVFILTVLMIVALIVLTFVLGR